MAYTEVITVATGDKWTAANHNLYIRDNFEAGVPAILQAAGDLVYATGEKAATILPIGPPNSILKSVSGMPAWGFQTNPYAKVTKTNLSVNHNTTTTIAWAGEEYDTNGFVDLGSNNQRITIPAGMGGIYIVIAYISTPNGTSADRTVNILKNGSNVSANISKDPTVMHCYVLSLEEGDYLTMTAHQNSGSSMTMYSLHMEIVKV